MRQYTSRGKVFILLFLLAGTSVPLFAGEKEIALDPLGDALTAGLGFASVLTTELIAGLGQPPALAFPSADQVNGFDRSALFPYSSSQDTASDITQYAAALVPAFLAIGTGSRDWLDIGVMYFEAAMISFGVKNILKLAITRYRPYMYFADPPQQLIAAGDYANSFPSGHTTMAFTGATFFTYMFSYYHPKSLWIIPVAACSYGLAVTTAVLRVTGGSHFMTDVLAGAVIGSLSGFLVPFFHMKKNDSSLAVEIGPDTVSARLSFN